jgi:hypothetical protein
MRETEGSEKRGIREKNGNGNKDGINRYGEKNTESEL